MEVHPAQKYGTIGIDSSYKEVTQKCSGQRGMKKA